MRQQSFIAEDSEKYRKKTRKGVFLEEIDQIVPWQHGDANLEKTILEGSSRTSRMTAWKDVDVSSGDAHDRPDCFYKKPVGAARTRLPGAKAHAMYAVNSEYGYRGIYPDPGVVNAVCSFVAQAK